MFDFLNWGVAMAQGAQKAQPSVVEMLILPVGFLVIMYFLIIRPQQKRSREHQNLVSNLKTGDEVVTTGGIIGKVRSVADAFVTVEIAANTNVKVTKSSIVSLTKAQSPAK